MISCREGFDMEINITTIVELNKNSRKESIFAKTKKKKLTINSVASKNAQNSKLSEILKERKDFQ